MQEMMPSHLESDSVAWLKISSAMRRGIWLHAPNEYSSFYGHDLRRMALDVGHQPCQVVGAAIVSCWAFRKSQSNLLRKSRCGRKLRTTSHLANRVLDTLGLLPSLPFVGDASNFRREATVRRASHPGHAADPHPVPKQLPRQLHPVTPAPLLEGAAGQAPAVPTGNAFTLTSS
jgi:hypothetical protein